MNTTEIWSCYAKDLRQFIISKVKNDTITDDILQDTFLKIHTKLNSLTNKTKVKSWCFAIAKNTIIDYWKNSNKTFEITNLEVDYQPKSTAHTEHDCLYGILKSLPEKYKKPLFLSDIKGLKQQDVASQLKQSLSTTKSQIQRARKLIAQGFIDCCGFSYNENGYLIGELKDKADCKVCR